MFLRTPGGLLHEQGGTLGPSSMADPSSRNTGWKGWEGAGAAQEDAECGWQGLEWPQLCGKVGKVGDLRIARNGMLSLRMDG